MERFIKFRTGRRLHAFKTNPDRQIALGLQLTKEQLKIGGLARLAWVKEGKIGPLVHQALPFGKQGRTK